MSTQQKTRPLGWVRFRQSRYAHYVKASPEYSGQLLRTWCGIHLTAEQADDPDGLSRCAHCVRSGL